jgi:undecaprenyl diphosphate synthase
MVDVIRWCFELGVRHVSVYAFSIDNFRRGADEVEGLMRLAADKFEELSRVGGWGGGAGAGWRGNEAGQG